MTKQEYITWKQDPKADGNDALFFYYLLKGGKLTDKGEFVQQLNSWILKLSHGFMGRFKMHMEMLISFTITKMDEYYGISQ